MKPMDPEPVPEMSDNGAYSLTSQSSAWSSGVADFRKEDPLAHFNSTPDPKVKALSLERHEMTSAQERFSNKASGILTQAFKLTTEEVLVSLISTPAQLQPDLPVLTKKTWE